jgi:ribosomal protein S20
MQAQSRAEAGELLLQAYKVLDNMTSRGVLHANTAARHKSKLAKYVSSLSS